MRDYDDYDDQSIRLYTPVLQRVIILAAVVITVPVIMWTITTFVRSNVARPKAPLLEHVASTNTRIPLIAAPPSPAPASADESATPQRADSAAASDAPNPAAEIKRGTANPALLPDSNPAPSAAIRSSATSQQTAPMRAPFPASPPAAAGGDASMTNLTAASTASLPRLPQLRPTDSAASSGPGSSDRGIAWPNPNATSPPDFTAPRLAAPPAPVRTAAAEVLPVDDPIRGPVPLPRHRPSILAMAATTAAPTATTMAGGGPVPLPRARPGVAPAAATDTVVETRASSGRTELENAR